MGAPDSRGPPSGMAQGILIMNAARHAQAALPLGRQLLSLRSTPPRLSGFDSLLSDRQEILAESAGNLTR